MSEYYTSAVQWGNAILVRGVHAGQRFSVREKFTPTLFTKNTKSKERSGWNTLYGSPLSPISFESINDAKDFVKKYEGVEAFPIFGNTKFAYQYVAENYPDEIEYNLHDLKIFTLDIEVESERGFPDPMKADEEILLITVKEKSTQKITTFGRKKFNIHKVQNFDTSKYEYVYCESEVSLLTQFLDFWKRDHPDIVTGWNVDTFDITYLINRIRKILPAGAEESLSPWKAVKEGRIFQKFSGGREEQTYEIVGVAVLDYLALYRKFTYKMRESYKLDFIAKVELKRQKLKNPYKTMREFYTKDWHLYVEYNVIDVDLVEALDDKMKLLDLIVQMAYDAKCNYNDVFSPVRMWDCIIYNELRNQHIAPPQTKDNVGRRIEGAYVKIPAPGRYDWIASFDAASLYPSIIMQYNMSPEMLLTGVDDRGYTKLHNLTVDELLERPDYHPMEDTAVAANGWAYSKTKQGVFPKLVERIFNERKFFKGKMLDAKKEYEKSKDPVLVKEIAKYRNIEQAKKIQLNSLYGAMANPYFRFYDDRIAEGITITGQFITRYVGKRLNEELNKLCKTENFDYAFYNDTDSCYVTLKPLDHFFPKDKVKAIDMMDTICKEKISPIIDKATAEIFQYTNAFKNCIFFKREILADTGIWTVKKRYAMSVWDDEGVRHSTPETKIVGMETNQSTTPELVRNALEEMVKTCLHETEKDLQKKVREFEIQFRKSPPNEIAFTKGINNMIKYGGAGEKSKHYKSGTPIQVRAALLFNAQIKADEKLFRQYELIQDGDKIKFVYLLKQNPMGENIIGFPGELPEELDLNRYIDYNTMYEKTFLNPLTTVTDSIGWSPKPKASLASLFGE